MYLILIMLVRGDVGDRVGDCNFDGMVSNLPCPFDNGMKNGNR